MIPVTTKGSTSNNNNTSIAEPMARLITPIYIPTTITTTTTTTLTTLTTFTIMLSITISITRTSTTTILCLFTQEPQIGQVKRPCSRNWLKWASTIASTHREGPILIKPKRVARYNSLKLSHSTNRIKSNYKLNSKHKHKHKRKPIQILYL